MITRRFVPVRARRRRRGRRRPSSRPAASVAGGRDRRGSASPSRTTTAPPASTTCPRSWAPAWRCSTMTTTAISTCSSCRVEREERRNEARRASPVSQRPAGRAGRHAHARVHRRDRGRGHRLARHTGWAWRSATTTAMAFVDLYVTALGSNTLYRNNGNGTFEDVTSVAGVDDTRWSTSAAFVDIDRDGHLDLYVANYVDFTLAANKPCTEPAGARDYCSPVGLSARARSTVPQPRQRHVRGRVGAGGHRCARTAPGSACRSATTTATDGWTSTSPTTPRPISCGATRATAPSTTRGCCRARHSTRPGRPEGSMGIASGDYDADGDEDIVVTNSDRRDVRPVRERRHGRLRGSTRAASGSRGPRR